MKSGAADTVLCGYTSVLRKDVESKFEALRNLPLPFFEENCLHDLCREATELFASQPTMLELHNTNICIVGDLHGSIFDLIRILKEFDDGETTFLFLGDYVDRGSFSVEVVTLVYALAVRHPGRYLLLRGNHECSSVSANYGFRDQVVEQYGNDSVWTWFVESFAYLPLAALLDDTILCVHGGISRVLKHLDQLRALTRPIHNIADSQLVKDLLWADPSEKTASYVESARMKGAFDFGCTVVWGFLHNNNLTNLVRAHQYTEQSVKYNCNCVYTVFSASSYECNGSNPSAILAYNTEEKKVHHKVMPALPRLQHSDMQYFTMRFIRAGTVKKARRMSISLQMPLQVPGLATTSTSILRKGMLPGQRSIQNFNKRSTGIMTPWTGVRRRSFNAEAVKTKFPPLLPGANA